MTPPDSTHRIFRGALLASFALLVYMFLPFFAVLLTVSVLVVVTWPVFRRLAARIGRVPAAILTTTTLFVVILGPTGTLVWFGIRQAAESAQEWVAFVGSGGLDRMVDQLEAQVPALSPLLQRMPNVDQWASSVLQSAAGQVGAWVSAIVQFVAEGAIHVLVGLASMLALYIEGPKLLANFRRIGLLPDEYLNHMFDVFRQFAQNVIVGMFATTASQGLVAALGYWLAGVDRVALLGFLTAVLSQFPIIGSLVVWLPVTIQLVVNERYGAATFVAIWSLALTGTVDNFLKPIVYQSGLKVHPILVLIALLAGLTTFGPGGLLVGPLALVLFLTLWTLYDRDVLQAGA